METPFFAQFLERQEFPEVKTDIKAGPGHGRGGPPLHTLKYPSDDGEGGVEI